MAAHIPFIYNPAAAELTVRYYADSEVVRLSLERAEAYKSLLPGSIKLWLDPGVDGLDNLEIRRSSLDQVNGWYEFMKSVPGFERMGDAGFQANPDPVLVKEFATFLLDLCASHQPAWITAPQLPGASDASRHKINRLLAKLTREWKEHRHFSGRIILPLVFTHQSQIRGKTERNPRIKQAARCYQEAQADGYWAVDRSLDDDTGSKTLRNTRFPDLVALHQELNQAIPSPLRIAGPYWGMNLLLWARGLVDHPAMGAGHIYQYFLAGTLINPPTPRLMIPPLRRRAAVSHLEWWLASALVALGENHPSYPDMLQLRQYFASLPSPEMAREQVAAAYKQWFDFLAALAPANRAQALFQDLSSAYALGKLLPEIEGEGTGRRPEAVVEPLMLNCL